MIVERRYNPAPGSRTFSVRGGVGVFGSGTASFFGSTGLSGNFGPFFIQVLEL